MILFTDIDNYWSCIKREHSITATCFAILSLLCLLFHVYIVFSYNFRCDNEEKQPIQNLFVSLSVYEAFSCLCYCSQCFIIAFACQDSVFWYKNGARYYLVNFVVSSLDSTSSYLVVLLLAVSRFYSICRIRKYHATFTKSKIVIYFLAIFLITMIGKVAFLLVKSYMCYIKNGSQDQNTCIRSVKFLEIALYLVFVLLITAIIIVIYWRISRVKFREISKKTKLNKVTFKLQEAELFDEKTPITLKNVFDDSIQMETYYITSVNVSVAITTSFFVIHAILAAYFFQEYRQFLETNDLKIPVHTYDAYFYGDVVMFPALFNPVVFYLVNEDFRVKLKRPIRVLKICFMSRIRKEGKQLELISEQKLESIE